MQELLKEINMNIKAQEAMQSYELSEGEYQEWKCLFYRDTQQFTELIKKQKSGELLALCLYCKMAVDIAGEFEKKQIPKSVYYDTFKDLTIWSESFYKKKQQYGVDELEWLSLPLKMQLFRIGRLQFEPRILEEEIGITFESETEIEKIVIEKDAEILEIHIPEGDPLSEQNCRASFRGAVRFFDTYFGKRYQYGSCSSWLLSPYVMELLGENSNIRKFEKLFHVYHVDYSYRQAEERVFGSVRPDKENYPENTSLQRKIKALAVSGYDVGIGCGICRLWI